MLKMYVLTVMKELNKLNIDTLFKVVSVIPGILIILGTLKMTIRYVVFDINIIEYTSLSEMIMSAVLETFFLTVYIIVLASMGMFGDKPMYMRSENYRPNWVSDNIVYISTSVLASSVIFTSLPIDDDASGKYWRMVILVSSMYIFIFLIFTLVVHNVAKSLGPTVNPNVVKVSLMSLVLIVWSLLHSSNMPSINEKYGRKPSQVSSIFLEDKTEIKLDSSLVYIGRVENFTFLFNRKTEEKTVIPNSDIKKYVYR